MEEEDDENVNKVSSENWMPDEKKKLDEKLRVGKSVIKSFEQGDDDKVGLTKSHFKSGTRESQHDQHVRVLSSLLWLCNACP